MADYDCEWCDKVDACDSSYHGTDCAYSDVLVGAIFNDEVGRVDTKIKDCIEDINIIISESKEKDVDGDLEYFLNRVKDEISRIRTYYLDDCTCEEMIEKCKKIFPEKFND